MTALPKVVIAGRPNVGKSTLMNRILGRREAIVEERPGVTRDRKVVTAEWQGHEFDLIDTGGWLAAGTAIDRKVSAQAEQAIADAAVVLLVVDSTVGVTDEDEQFVRSIRRLDVPVFVVANKVDDLKHSQDLWELLSLGFGQPYGVSALHGRGVGDLLDAVVTELGDEPVAADSDDDEQRIFSIALVGRPNVGKSTLFNRLIGDERSVTHDMPGTTRDTVDTVVETDRGPVRFLDTAGMRRRSRIDEDTEYYSVVRALSAVDKADVALLVIDASEGVTHQDQRLAERVDAAGCPIVVVLNKWDLADTEHKHQIAAQLDRKLSFLPDVPEHRISALSGRGIGKLLPSLFDAIDAYQTRVPTNKVNEVIRSAQAAHPAPNGARILYATQGATDPPTFTLFTNRSLSDSYVRYIENQIRETFNLAGTPIKLRVRKRT
ncbi:MAG: ribosome biogenesis GTPase Der [Acidimicrobiales bacterium]|nr:ribosome biogenesis GTPase Der [Acidimicrobiales bacterium]